MVLFSRLPAQEDGHAHFAVSYLTSSEVFFDAGRDQRVRQDDTLVVARKGKEIGRIVVRAVAKQSSSANVLVQH